MYNMELRVHETFKQFGKGIFSICTMYWLFFSDSARETCFTLFRILMHPKLCAQIAAQWTTIHIYWLLCPSHAWNGNLSHAWRAVPMYLKALTRQIQTPERKLLRSWKHHFKHSTGSWNQNILDTFIWIYKINHLVVLESEIPMTLSSLVAIETRCKFKFIFLILLSLWD